MFENIVNFFKGMGKKNKEEISSKETAKERLQLVLMQDRASVSADFLDLMRQEIIEVIKKYIDVDEKDIDVRLTNKSNEDGTTGSPALYANIPIGGIKQDIIDNNKKAEETVKKEPAKDKIYKDKKDNDTKNKEVKDSETAQLKEESKTEEIVVEKKEEIKEEVKKEVTSTAKINSAVSNKNTAKKTTKSKTSKAKDKNKKAAN